MRKDFLELKYKRAVQTRKLYQDLANVFDYFIYDYADALHLGNDEDQQKLIDRLIFDINEIELVKTHIIHTDKRKERLDKIFKDQRCSGYSVFAKLPNILKTFGFNFNYG